MHLISEHLVKTAGEMLSSVSTAENLIPATSERSLGHVLQGLDLLFPAQLHKALPILLPQVCFAHSSHSEKL